MNTESNWIVPKIWSSVTLRLNYLLQGEPEPPKVSSIPSFKPARSYQSVWKPTAQENSCAADFRIESPYSSSKNWELSGSYQDQQLAAAKSRGKNSVKETTLGMRIFLSHWVSRFLLHWAVTAQLFSTGRAAVPCLENPPKIQGKLLSSLCIQAGHTQACSPPDTPHEEEWRGSPDRYQP